MNLRPVLRPVLRDVLRSPLERGGGFNPLIAWAGNGAGMWLDPSDINTGFQNSAGTTRQTATGQPTGLRLDKRLGLAFGPELVVNGDFSNGTTGWTAVGATHAVVGGQLEVTSAGLSGRAVQTTTPLIVGQWYEVTGTIVAAGTSLTRQVRVDDNVTGGLYANPIVPGPFRSVFRAISTTLNIMLMAGDTAGWTAYFDDISVRALGSASSNHVLQASAGARPEFTVAGAISTDYRDGVDDAYGATFSAGALTANMDCLLAINRESVADGVAAFMTGGTNFFGMWETSASRPDNGAGAPTYFVNGVPTTATRTALKAAMTVSSHVIAEMRGLDLSAWTSINFGFLTSYPGPGDQGPVMLFPSNAAIRDRMRRVIGAKVGLSL